MIEVRPFCGDPADLAAFINACWNDRYLARDLIPTYSAADLSWQMLESPDRSFHLAAYDGSQLVGCFLADRVRVRLNGQSVEGTQGSYLSVHPDYGARGVATRLINTLERLHRAHDLKFFLGYVNSSPTSSAYKFWSSFQRTFPKRYRTLGPVQFWMRFLKAGHMASELDNAAEAAGLKVLSLLQPAPAVRAGSPVRPFHSGDLAACHLLLDAEAQRHRLAQLWNAADLRHELAASPVSHTLVSSNGSGVQGFATSFHWPMKGRGRIPAEVIDLLLLHDLSAAGKRELLRSCVADIAARGAWVAVLPRPDFRDAATFLACGFVPVPNVCTLMTLFPSAELDWAGLDGSGLSGAGERGR
ncbi:GNAT family N-acetyltransferase (plasmid) [Deinococcus sp. KNUC1210]|uniref:GNAT family N-acetyltransferase n=1 Tax=Deinococcus sp. KNUC1210 TaxID=2917691 RepID=UPI001EF12990|nr:GNAT family N-acetyltransferase [Deinococcus sp. KNUC1210]ULH14289.1 GNAT family N-acetyltransferase [Deinococcus sp. KNUC1210]